MKARMAGSALAALAGGAAGVGGTLLVGGVAGALTPEDQRPATQQQFAERQLSGDLQRYPGLSVKDLAMAEGLRQAMLAGEIGGADVMELVNKGKVPGAVVMLLAESMDFDQQQEELVAQQARELAAQGELKQMKAG
jgi:hypothetical protein